MSSLNEILTFEYENAYDFAYVLPMKKNFSTPKIYDANGDIKKRWYVYFSYRDPNTGLLKRQTPFYGNANKYKTKSDRMFVLQVYKRKILELLKRGYNPFEDNTELFQKEKLESEKTKENTTKQKAQATVENVATKQTQNDTTEQEIVATDRKTIKEGFEFAINLKKREVSAITIRDYKSKSKLLQHYLSKHFPEVIYIDEITKKMMMQFLNSILVKSSPRTRNNYRVEISSMFQVLEDNEIIPVNFFKKIKVLKTNPERHKTYSNQLDKEIFEYLTKKDPILLLYIKFISYNFLRPIEVNRIKVGDINIEEKMVSFKAKNKPLKTKIIPDILFKELPDLSKMNKDYYLFTPDKIGGSWDATEVNRRDYFSKRFKNVVKEHFNLGGNYGLYSFRHTYITKLYRELVKNSTPFETKSILMLITGHSTMTALEKYLRDIDAELPQDYSKYFKKD